MPQRDLLTALEVLDESHAAFVATRTEPMVAFTTGLRPSRSGAACALELWTDGVLLAVSERRVPNAGATAFSFAPPAPLIEGGYYGVALVTYPAASSEASTSAKPLNPLGSDN